MTELQQVLLTLRYWVSEYGADAFMCRRELPDGTLKLAIGAGPPDEPWIAISRAPTESAHAWIDVWVDFNREVDAFMLLPESEPRSCEYWHGEFEAWRKEALR